MKTSNIYQFTLILEGLSETAKNIEDKLFKAGCDDALINFRNDTVCLDFDRKSSSFEKAVLSAIKNVETSSLKVKNIKIEGNNYL